MPIRTLTKAEFRQKFHEDEAFVFFRQVLNEKFNVEQRLLNSWDSERLWMVKGQSEVLSYLNDVDKILDYFEDEDELMSD